MTIIIDSVVELERGFWAAAGDADFYRRHMADDGLCLLPPGVMDKEATTAAIEHAPPWDEHRFEDVVVYEHGDAAATICYRVEARRGSTRYVAAISTTYRHEGGRWQLLVHQQTPLAP